ncbi:trypsin-like serine protease [Streptomyces sp. UNOB3_S3]|uniref:trypsin-like serine protease n=1 Tax=Streptomyces sp. UNOB3_S3 TaxID=2871682 RepID=UPI001E3E1BE9|nr:trypsin-like serine protease [Streptomyces sp. UNOB3_S3]MCC3776633.1 S1 family peptidase [Streptomyces sp. UNOB3_S3]
MSHRSFRTLSCCCAAATLLPLWVSAPHAAAFTGDPEKVKPAEAPWFVTIVGPKNNKGKVIKCSGVLTSPTRIATADHCIRGDEEQIIHGTYTIFQGSHADYLEKVTTKNAPVSLADDDHGDVAMLILEQRFKKEAALPVALSAPAPPETGVIYASGETPDDRIGKSIRKLPVTTAKLKNPNPYYAVAVSSDKKQVACESDSGGPLVVSDGEGTLVVSAAVSGTVLDDCPKKPVKAGGTALGVLYKFYATLMTVD